MTVTFYPVLAAAAFPYAGILERHAEGMLARSLREQAPLACLLDHDPAQRVGSTEAGTLRLTVERGGVRAELTTLPDTPPGRRLGSALAVQ